MTHKKKTIFIPVSGRPQSRDILRTDVLKTLCKAEDVLIVVFVKSEKVNHYRKEFQYPNLIFEGIDFDRFPISRIDTLFNTISMYYVNTTTGRFLRKLWFWHEEKAPIKLFVSRIMLVVFGGIRPLRALMRKLDYHFVRDERFAEHFEKYKPDLIFAPNIALPLDRSFLRHAKGRNVVTVGMIKSWDNITYAKYPYRILPDTLICHNHIIEKEAMDYLDMPKDRIFVSGMPQHDFYINETRSTRTEFCKRFPIPEDSRIILFTSQGSVANKNEWQVLVMLARALDEKKLPEDIVIIFRQHPTEKMALENIPNHKRIIIDDSKTNLSEGDVDFSEILTHDMVHLADSLHYADVIVTTTSSISIDGSTFDTPVINISFDGWEKLPFHLSVRRKFTKHHAHYQHIVNSGGIYLAPTFDDLCIGINRYLEHPEYEREGRKRIVKEQCFTHDGKSGTRLAQCILKHL